ncbi:hypothetical protein ACFIOY_09705 [Bradyrhizobium sp. TZ2]
MTHFDLLGLYAISASKERVYFSAVGGNSESRAPSCLDVVKCDSSEIFGLNFEREAHSIRNPPHQLKPVFLVDGISAHPTISADGTRLVFLNTSREKFTYRYNLKVSRPNGDPLGTIELRGIAFSAGAFVGKDLLVNELFKDRYRVSAFDQDLNRVDSIDIDNSAEFLSRVQRIELTINPADGVL